MTIQLPRIEAQTVDSRQAYAALAFAGVPATLDDVTAALSRAALERGERVFLRVAGPFQTDAARTETADVPAGAAYDALSLPVSTNVWLSAQDAGCTRVVVVGTAPTAGVARDRLAAVSDAVRDATYDRAMVIRDEIGRGEVGGAMVLPPLPIINGESWGVSGPAIFDVMVRLSADAATVRDLMTKHSRERSLRVFDTGTSEFRTDAPRSEVIRVETSDGEFDLDTAVTTWVIPGEDGACHLAVRTNARVDHLAGAGRHAAAEAVRNRAYDGVVEWRDAIMPQLGQLSRPGRMHLPLV